MNETTTPGPATLRATIPATRYIPVPTQEPTPKDVRSRVVRHFCEQQTYRNVESQRGRERSYRTLGKGGQAPEVRAGERKQRIDVSSSRTFQSISIQRTAARSENLSSHILHCLSSIPPPEAERSLRLNSNEIAARGAIIYSPNTANTANVVVSTISPETVHWNARNNFPRDSFVLDRTRRDCFPGFLSP